MSFFPFTDRRDGSPEGAPAYVALAKVLVTGGLLDQQVDLLRDLQPLLLVEITSGQLVPDPLDYIQSFLVHGLRLHSVP